MILIIEYQQCADAVTMEKTRRSYTFCDVQAGLRFTKNTSKTFKQGLREIEAPNRLLHLFEPGIDLALISGEDWNGNPEEQWQK